MNRLHPQTITEIALSLVPLANAPTWVKAVWVERELQDRGLWRDDVFELVRPFLVSRESRAAQQTERTPKRRDTPSAPPAQDATGEITVSHPLQTPGEAKWAPSFEGGDPDQEKHPRDRDEQARGSGPLSRLGRHVDQESKFQDIEPKAGSQPAAGEQLQAEQVPPARPDLERTRLKSKSLSPDEAELASMMHLLAVSTRLNDGDTDSSSFDDLPRAAAPADESRRPPHTAGDSLPEKDHPVDSQEKGSEAPLPAQVREPSMPGPLSNLDLTGDPVAGRSGIVDQPPVAPEPGRSDEIAQPTLESGPPAPGELADDDVPTWSEQRRDEREITAEFAEPERAAEPDEVEKVEALEEEPSSVPGESVLLWSEQRRDEREITAEFAEHESAAEPEEVEKAEALEEEPSSVPGESVFLWSEQRRDEREITAEFAEPERAAEPEEVEKAEAHEEEPSSEPGESVLLWSEQRRDEREIAAEFAEPERAAEPDEVEKVEALEEEPSAVPGESVLLWSEQRRDEHEIAAEFAEPESAAEPDEVEKAETPEEEPSAVPGESVLLWSEQRRDEREIAAEFAEPERATELEEVKKAGAHEEKPSSVPGESVLLWSEQRRDEREIAAEFGLDSDSGRVARVERARDSAIPESTPPTVEAEPTVAADAAGPETDRVDIDASEQSPEPADKQSLPVTPSPDDLPPVEPDLVATTQQDHAAVPDDSPQEAADPQPVAETAPERKGKRRRGRKSGASDRKRLLAARVDKPKQRRRKSESAAPAAHAVSSAADQKKSAVAKPTPKAPQPVARTAEPTTSKFSTGKRQKTAARSRKVQIRAVAAGPTAHAVSSAADQKKSAVAKPTPKAPQPVARAAKSTTSSDAASRRRKQMPPDRGEQQSKSARTGDTSKSKEQAVAGDTTLARAEKLIEVRKALTGMERALKPGKHRRVAPAPADPSEAAAAADRFGIHITAASGLDGYRLLYFESILESVEGDWEASGRSLEKARRKADAGAIAEIWEKAVRQSRAIHTHVSSGGADRAA